MPSLYPHEVRKIAQGAGAASGFAGFFFPSLRPRGLGEEKPVPPYSAIVYKEGDEVRAEDWKGRKIASGEAGVDDASVIQSAYAKIVDCGGGCLSFEKATYYNINLKITNDLPLILDLGASELRGDGTNPVIEIETNHIAEYHPIIRGGRIDGNNRGSVGIQITDSYHVIIQDTSIVDCSKGINPRLKSHWTESLILDRVRIRFCDEGLSFENVGSGSKSFGQSRIMALDIGGCTKGIAINQDTSVFRSFIVATIWIPENGIGIYMDGSPAFTWWHLGLESQYNSAIGINFGANYDGTMEFYARFYGTFTYINNPHSKKYLLWISPSEVRAPSGVFREGLIIATEDGTPVLKLIKNAADAPIIGVSNADVTFWDYGTGSRAGINVDTITTTGKATLKKIVNLEVYRDDYGGNFASFTFPSAEKGRFFFAEDTNAANPAKRLYVCLDGSTWSYVDLT